ARHVAAAAARDLERAPARDPVRRPRLPGRLDGLQLLREPDRRGEHRPAAEAGIERETYLSLRNAFRTSYRGNRAPLSFANHFETWNHWAYDRALSRFVLESCRLPGVRCVTFRELVDWLDAQPPRRLRRFRVYRS
ncbi:MAG TPA: hypothetical protein VGJ27_11635, partial [Gaiellaceae bacterium]